MVLDSILHLPNFRQNYLRISKCHKIFRCAFVFPFCHFSPQFLSPSVKVLSNIATRCVEGEVLSEVFVPDLWRSQEPWRKELRNVLLWPIVWPIFINFPHETLRSFESLVTPIDWTRGDIHSKWESKMLSYK